MFRTQIHSGTTPYAQRQNPRGDNSFIASATVFENSSANYFCFRQPLPTRALIAALIGRGNCAHKSTIFCKSAGKTCSDRSWPLVGKDCNVWVLFCTFLHSVKFSGPSASTTQLL